jgi:hypothetical protein
MILVTKNVSPKAFSEYSGKMYAKEFLLNLGADGVNIVACPNSPKFAYGYITGKGDKLIALLKEKALMTP